MRNNAQLTADLFERVVRAPADPDTVRRFIAAQAVALHAANKHATTCGTYGAPTFEACGVRWCQAARLVLGLAARPADPQITY